MCDICRNKEIEKAYKALRLNSGVSYFPYGSNDYNPKLLGASKKKPTILYKRLKFSGHSPYNIKLRDASGSDVGFGSSFGSSSYSFAEGSYAISPDADGIVRLKGAPLMMMRQRQQELEKERADKALRLNYGF